MTVCIQYARPTSGQNDNEIYGLDVAVNNLLVAWFKYGQQEKFICRPIDMPSFEHFKALALASGIDVDNRVVGLNAHFPKHNLEPITCLFRPDPLITDLVWQRTQLQGRGFATCGLIHTMSGERIARVVSDLCTAPSDATDALICPSKAIRDAVQRLWQIHEDYLNQRFGSSFRCPVQTPVIPLGIDTEKFLRITTKDKRAAQRQALNAAPDEIIILFVGRLSFATKAHPLPLLLAAERAAKRSKRKLRLVMMGYFKPQDMETHFRKLIADICATVQVDFIMNNDPRFPDGLWACADIFTSLIDNIQESFGLTPIEAMASGLPSVISDWNGYRDSVRDGQDGYLIPTLIPPPSAGQEIAEMYYNVGNHGVYLTATVQSTAVDIERCAEAFQNLANDDEKRMRMGESARQQARRTYDWKTIIKAYENLWQELAQKRQACAKTEVIPKNWPAVHPAYPNPWQMFRGFSSATLSLDTRVCTQLNTDEINVVFRHEMNFFVPEMLMSKEMMLDLITVIRNAGTTKINEIISKFPSLEHPRLWRCFGWLLKHGIIKEVK